MEAKLACVSYVSWPWISCHLALEEFDFVDKDTSSKSCGGHGVRNVWEQGLTYWLPSKEALRMPGYSFGDGCGFSWQMPNLIQTAQVPLIFLNNPASKLGCYALLTMSSSQVEGKSTILVWHINECCPHDNFTSFLETLTSKLDYLGCVGRNHCFQMI